MIYSQRSSFGRLLANSTDAPDAPLTVSTKSIRAVEFDPILHYVYWVSCLTPRSHLVIFFIIFKKKIDGRGSVRKSMENGTKPTLIIGGSGSHSQPFDLALDIIGRLLFWTCSHANTINITR